MLLCLLALAAHAENVAHIVAVEGKVEVTTAAGTTAATPGADLDEADTIHTGADGAAILLLANDRLVRVDEDLTLQIDHLVLLHAPTSDVPVSAQLTDLLYPGERESMRGVAEAERLAGWDSRLQAATAVPAQSTDAGKGSPATASGGGGGSGGSGYGTDSRPHKMRGGGTPDSLAPQARPATTVLTHAEVERVLRSDLAECTAQWASSDALKKGSTVIVHVRVQNGHIARLIGDGGLTPPPCARDRLVGVAVTGGSFDVTLTIP